MRVVKVKVKPTVPVKTRDGYFTEVETSLSYMILDIMSRRLRHLFGERKKLGTIEFLKRVTATCLLPFCFLMPKIMLILSFPFYKKMVKRYLEDKREAPFDNTIQALTYLISLAEPYEWILEIKDIIAITMDKEIVNWGIMKLLGFLQKDTSFWKTLMRAPHTIKLLFGITKPPDNFGDLLFPLSFSEDGLGERREIAAEIINSIPVEELRVALFESLKWGSEEFLRKILEARHLGKATLIGRNLRIYIKVGEKEIWIG